MRHLLRIADLEPAELVELLELARAVKADPAAYAESGRGRAVAILFEKPSLRTRFSVEAALARIGAHPIGAYDREVGLDTREPVPDVAQVLSRYVDAIVIRTFGHDRAARLASAAKVPVVNALSDGHHPLQALADLLTIAEGVCEGDVRALKDATLAYVGDGNNVCHSLIEAAALVGLTVRCAAPEGFDPAPDIVRGAKEAGGDVTLTPRPEDAVAGADVVYTDVWASMGQESESDARRRRFAAFSVTPELMARARPGAIFLHCLPAHRGDEVAAEVIDGPASRVFEQAENRMHTAAALFVRLFGAG